MKRMAFNIGFKKIGFVKNLENMEIVIMKKLKSTKALSIKKKLILK